MPWCDDCAKFWNPNSMPPDGTCPTCGRVIGDPPDTSVPWHFWLLVGALVIYLGWRAVQGFQWLLDNGQPGPAVGLGILLAGLIAIGVRWALHARRTRAASSADVDSTRQDGGVE